MKKLCFLFTLFFCLIFLCPVTAAAPNQDIPSPHDAATAFMNQLKDLDTAPIQAAIDAAVPGQYGETACQLVLTPVLSRLEYELGSFRSDGRTAAVDLSITAADMKVIASDIAAQAIGCAAIRQWTGLPLDVESYVTARITAVLESGSLTTIRTNTTLYLTLGGDEQWKVDLSDLRNLDFLEALTGGMVEFDGALATVAAISGAVDK